MEALGVAASLGQLIEFALKTIKYLNSVKDASKDRTRLLKEVPSLLSLLVSLKTSIDEKQSDTWFDGIKLLAVKDGPLDQLRDTLKQLIDKLKPKKGLQKVARKMIWTLDKDYCEDLLRQIDRAKSTIGLALHGDTLYASPGQKMRHKLIFGLTVNLPKLSKRTRPQFAASTSESLPSLKDSKIFMRRRTVSLLSAAPGAGKSILASVIVDFLGKVQTKATSTGVAAIYCQFKEREMQTSENLFAGACVQLVQQSLGPLPKALVDVHESHSKLNTRPNCADILKVFDEIVQNLNNVYLVIDALDESSEANQKILLKQAEALSGNTRLLVTTRHVDNIVNRFRNCPKIEIRATDMDLKNYVSSRIASKNRLESMVRDDPSLENHVCEQITTRAGGMFLAAKLHMDALSSKGTLKSLKKALEDLPTTLDELYNEALHRIEAQSPDDQQLAFNALRWVAYTYRPLGFRALQEALAIETGEEDFDSDGLPPISLVIDVCAGLLTADAETGKVRLVHYTTQDYMDSVLASKFPDAHALIAEDCISYLDYQVFQSTGPDEQIPLASGLFPYASSFWASHTMARRTPRLNTRIEIFLASSPSVHLLSIRNYDHYWPSRFGRRLSRCDGYGIAAFLGLCDELNASLPHIDNVDKLLNGQRYSSYTRPRSSALHLAAYNHQVETVCILLDHGADIGKKDSRGNTPLHIAIRCKALETVRTLVQRGADIMAKDSNLQIPFQNVWWSSPLPFLQYLVDAGTAVERQHLFESSPLMHSITSSNERETIQWVFGTALKDTDKALLPSTMLKDAARDGALYMVDTLLDFGADVNSKDNIGETALHGACYRDQPGVVGRLLERGIHINGRSTRGATALHHAAARGYEKNIEVLTGYDPDLNVQNFQGRPPLMAAIAAEHTSIALHLLCSGANTELHDACGMTALQIASAKGNVLLIQELLKQRHSLVHRSQYTLAVKYPDPRRLEASDSSNERAAKPFFRCLTRQALAVRLLLSPKLGEFGNGWEPKLTSLDSHQMDWKVFTQGMTALDIAMLRDDTDVINLLAPPHESQVQPGTTNGIQYSCKLLGISTIGGVLQMFRQFGDECQHTMEEVLGYYQRDGDEAKTESPEAVAEEDEEV
ncbi:MAG: hypothetical protein Q9192_005801 [Flavoplaca navasiana]